jgi:hypothetical protein
MKRNQKKFSRKNYKGGVVDSNMAKVSLAALKKRLADIELNLDTIKTKMGEVNPVEGSSRENNTGFGEAGYLEAPIGQNNPMKPNFASNNNGSEPITQNQFDEVDNLTDQIKILKKDPKVNKEKLKTKIGLRNALFNKYKIRYEYLKKEKDARKLSDAETDQYYILESNLNNRSFGGRGKSRRYRKSRKGKRTRKYKK